MYRGDGLDASHWGILRPHQARLRFSNRLQARQGGDPRRACKTGMQDFYIDARHCEDEDALWTALLSGLQAPNWHGHNLDALWDSLIVGDILGQPPPQRIFLHLPDPPPPALLSLLDRLQGLFAEAGIRQGTRLTLHLSHLAPNTRG